MFDHWLVSEMNLIPNESYSGAQNLGNKNLYTIYLSPFFLHILNKISLLTKFYQAVLVSMLTEFLAIV